MSPWRSEPISVQQFNPQPLTVKYSVYTYLSLGISYPEKEAWQVDFRWACMSSDYVITKEVVMMIIILIILFCANRGKLFKYMMYAAAAV